MENRIDRREELAEIRSRYAGEHPLPLEAHEEAAALWQVDCNDCGSVVDITERLKIETVNCHAEIKLHETGEGYWFYATSYMLSNSGAGYGIGVWDRYAFSSRDSARDAAIEELIKKVGEHRERREDAHAKARFIRKLEDERYEQLALLF